MVEIWRGPFLESYHCGHAVVCDEAGEIVQAWGDPDAIVLPRSAIKMLQAMPLITSGAADAASLTTEHLALSCASHNGAAIHTDRVQAWLKGLGLGDDDFRCGTQWPADEAANHDLVRRYAQPCQMHNNCSGKHSGFLTLSKHLGAGPEYINVDHPVQVACLDAFETVTGLTSPGYGIDGCSAPNFATTLHGAARAMAFYASAHTRTDAASVAATRLTQAMAKHPDLVAGEGKACTELMRAMQGAAVVKTGAEAVFTAILPGKKLGVALKIVDGTTRASECAIVSILVHLGVLDADHPAALKRRNAVIQSRRGLDAGMIKPAAGFL
jgi:L-asparaginase II